MVLWWKFYEEHKKRQFSQTQSHTLTETSDTLSESFNHTSETFNQTFFEASGTLNETLNKSISVTNESEFQIPLLFVSVNTENMFLTLSIVASVFTVRCCV